MKTLDKVRKNEICKILDFVGEPDRILRRFLELGFSRGERVKVLAYSMQNKVALIELRGYVLSVRSSLLGRVIVE